MTNIICQSCKKNFEIMEGDQRLLEMLNVPAPTFCPPCRLQRRMVWCNERTLYKRKCQLCNQDKILMFPENSRFTVYCKECWWSDSWNPMTFGRDYDESRPFLAQWKELYDSVPRMGKIQQGNIVGSEYVNRADDMRNCYLVFLSSGSEYCRYGGWNMFSKESVDCYNIFKCERCYECVDCRLSYNLAFSQESSNCRDSWFLYNCVNVSNSFGCVNLRNKQYCFFNEQLTKEMYEEKIKSLDLGFAANVEKLRAQFDEFRKQFIVPALVTHQSNDMSGNWIESARNTHNSFSVSSCDNVRHANDLINCKDSMDYMSWANPGERVYESINAGRQIGNSKFLNECWDQVIDCEYSMNCHGVKNLFGCVGLRKAEYCILNKQYAKEEYEALVAKIKKQMNDLPYVDKAGRVYKYGEFYPVEFSPFAYNETVAQAFFPMTKDTALAQKFSWQDEAKRAYAITVQSADLPERASEGTEELTKAIVGCAHAGSCQHQCTTAFRILTEDIELYKRATLPLPRLCPNCRHYERLAKRNPMRLWSRTCQCPGAVNHQHGEIACTETFETSYSPDRSEKVYCIDCYQQEVA